LTKELLYQDKKIIYYTYGKGKPVVLIHGFGEYSRVWHNQVEYLKNKFFLIIPDLPGSGQSDLVEDMSMEGMAEIIQPIMHKESIESCIIIGHSMGGYVTLALAEKYPQLFTGLGLFHSSAFPDTEEKRLVRQKGIEFINKHEAFEFLKTSTPNLFSQQFKDKNPFFVGEYIDTLNNFSSLALVKYYESMMQRPERINVLKSINVAVLMVMGKYDNAVPLNDGLKQCHLPERSYIHILRQSGHMGMLEESATANRILEFFLTEN